MKVLVFLFFGLVILGYIFMTINIVKSREKIHWLNLVAMAFFPFLWPMIYFYLKIYGHRR